jgi:hypothetical protein
MSSRFNLEYFNMKTHFLEVPGTGSVIFFAKMI